MDIQVPFFERLLEAAGRVYGLVVVHIGSGGTPLESGGTRTFYK